MWTPGFSPGRDRNGTVSGLKIICFPRPRAKPEYPPSDCARRSALRVLPRLLLLAFTTSPAQSERRQPDQQSNAENAKQG